MRYFWASGVLSNSLASQPGATMAIKPYIPTALPLEGLDYRRLVGRVGSANRAIARYDGLLRAIPNPKVMLSPLTISEAVLSSRIEGTQATLDDVLEHEAGISRDGEKERDIQEILNYRLALTQANAHLESYPIRLPLIRQIHRTLLESVRGQDKSPGDFRVDQNWIGLPGSGIEQATYVPPSPVVMRDHLENWERYLEFDDFDFLVQAAIVHAQFELIHPFLDGNGRIGRILIPLFLASKSVLGSPMFYLSEYLEGHRSVYYSRLLAISQDGDWDGWVEFFLTAIEEQAIKNCDRVTGIVELYEEMKTRIVEVTRSQWSVHLLDAVFARPIFQQTVIFAEMEERTGASHRTTGQHLKKMADAGILRQLRAGSGSRSTVWCFDRLLRAAEGSKA